MAKMHKHKQPVPTHVQDYVYDESNICRIALAIIMNKTPQELGLLLLECQYTGCNLELLVSTALHRAMVMVPTLKLSNLTSGTRDLLNAHLGGVEAQAYHDHTLLIGASNGE